MMDIKIRLAHVDNVKAIVAALVDESWKVTVTPVFKKSSYEHWIEYELEASEGDGWKNL